MDKNTTTAPFRTASYQDNEVSKTRYFLSGNSLTKWLSIILVGCVLFAFYLLISRIVLYNADDASIILEAQAMLNGNFLLRGWYIPSDHFLTIEIPLYAIGLLLGFSMTSLRHIVPSLFYTLVVLCGGYLIATSLSEKQRLWGWLALLGIIAFPSLYMVQKLIVGPIHVGTIFFVLVGLIAYKHFLSGARGKWLAFAVVVLIMVLTIVGDPFVEVLLVLPVLLTDGLQMLIRRRISLQKNALFFATLLAIAIARGVTWLLGIAGVHILTNINFVFASPPRMLSNLHFALTFVYTLFNANIFATNSFSLASVPVLLNAIVVSVFGLAIIYAIVARSKFSLFQTNTTPTTKIIQIVLWSTLGNLGAFILSTLGGPQAIRYLVPIFFLSELVTLPIIFALINRHILKIVVILVLIMNVIPFAISLYQAPQAVPSEVPALAIFKEHHLTQGLGTYWVAPFVTVLSEDQVVIHQIQLRKDGKIHPYYFLADEKWFDAAHLQQANFIVYRGTDNTRVYYNASVRSFGVPNHEYHAGNLTILTWDTPLITHLKGGYSFA